MQYQRPDIRRILRWLAAFLLLVGIVMVIRYFLFESYRISTDAMAEALQRGDCIVVNKLPVKGNPGRNRIVLLTSPLRQDTAISPLFISRIIGMPGDTIQVTHEGYSVNGKQYPRSPRALSSYFVAQGAKEEFLKAVNELNIPLRDVRSKQFGLALSLTTFEEYQLREDLSEEANQRFTNEHAESYALVVPRRNRAYRLDPATLNACKEAIIAETDGKAVIRDGKLYLDGKETSFFYFDQDYYWVLSDNTNEAIDSRHLGFIPADHIIGNALFCWFSRDIYRIFKPVN